MSGHYTRIGLSKVLKDSRDTLLGNFDLMLIPATNTHIVDLSTTEHQFNKTPPGNEEVVIEVSETDCYVSFF